MIDRDKVIKGLEEAEIMLTQAVDRGGEMAVIGAFKCLNRVTDALALLKEQADEQRARILTVEEVQPNELVYIEVPHSDEICPAFLVEKDWFEHRAWRTTGCGGCHSFLHDGYGRDWRCWSANPTDEQRWEVKWE